MAIATSVLRGRGVRKRPAAREPARRVVGGSGATRPLVVEKRQRCRPERDRCEGAPRCVHRAPPSVDRIALATRGRETFACGGRLGTPIVQRDRRCVSTLSVIGVGDASHIQSNRVTTPKAFGPASKDKRQYRPAGRRDKEQQECGHSKGLERCDGHMRPGSTAARRLAVPLTFDRPARRLDVPSMLHGCGDAGTAALATNVAPPATRRRSF